jgi:hypothetical protein
MPFKIRDCGFSHPEALAEKNGFSLPPPAAARNEAVTESQGN